MSESVAIVEKKPHKPGGCAGIFFQLFNWNRRFAKKKIFSKKLLPPAQPKQCAKKYGGDEMLPKLHLIANENSGGFPNTKKNGSSNNHSRLKPQMRSPSLVARLMGLESMPAIQKNKSSKETSSFQSYTEGGGNFASTQNMFGSSLENENGNEKHELRPQKARKTGPYERQALTKFSTEAFQFKSLLSRSRKHHRPKLVSPVKNPRMSSGRSPSRLIDVATRILEPGLQNSNRAKNAITYSSTTRKAIRNRNDFVMEQKMVSPDLPKDTDFHLSTDSTPISACKHCGSQLEKLEPTPNLEEKATPFPFPNYLNHNIEEIERSSNGPPITSFEPEKWQVSERYQELSIPFTAQPGNNRKLLSGEGQSQARWNSTSRESKRRDPQNLYRPHRQSQVSMVKERVPYRPRRASSVANAVDRNGTRLPIKANHIACDDESRSCNKRGGSLSPVRKRRSTSTNHTSESSNFPSCSIVRQRNANARCNIVGKKEKEIRLDSHSFNSTKRGSAMRRGDIRKITDFKGVNVTSPMNQKTESGITRSKTRELSSSGERDAKVNVENFLASSGDELGALLQQKLIELSCQEDDDLSTAVILHELISALAAEKPMVRNEATVESVEKIPCQSPQLPNKRYIFETKQKTARTSLGYVPEDEHLSPGSVLEASFSYDSCLSSSFGDGTASVNGGCNNIQSLIDLISRVSEVLLSLGFANTGLKQSKLAYAKEAILNMELVSKSANQSLSSIHFLIYELENLASTMWAEFGCLLGFEDIKLKNRIKEFVFDCVIEYLDMRYGHYSTCRFEPWTRMPLCSIADDLVAEVRRWASFGEYSLDEIIDFEMSHFHGKWTDFEIEEYETGAEIGKDVLQILVDEIVVELSEGKTSSKWI